MRLTYTEAKAIISETKKHFGRKAQVYLFGSRVDDTKKGGDIDLYIVPENKKEGSSKKKIAFLSDLKQLIGDQKIDLVIATDSSKAIEQIAIKEGIALDLDNLRVKKILNECDKHRLRINDAYQDMQLFMPLTAEKYQQLSKDEVQDIDQYLYRFSKLQDVMGEKLFKLIISMYEESHTPLTFIDTLNKIERLGIIHGVGDWKALREIRNALSHEYDDEPEQMSELINNIYSKKELIETIYDRAKKIATTGAS
ncbi:MAG: nucleotidyltransferase domain-containing protein [Candidatus Polarisedimenticolaceae bacterium]|nr:nucleotidyltransferase domain-containing protein [Candidatus Polarisedimenticolaceae bacterium]